MRAGQCAGHVRGNGEMRGKMNGQITKRTAWCGVWLGSLFMTAPCQAGPLFDWLFNRQPQTVATTAGYAPAPASSCGQGYCEQTVLQYVPQVAYRTVWEAVPVTTYRRTVSYNPANGLPMTCTQPCTSYTYQARRVPYTTFRPVYATVPVTAPAPAAVAPAAVAPTVAVPAPGCNCGSGGAYGMQTVPQTQPYYTTPSSEPAGATPWERVPRAETPGLPASPPPASTGTFSDEADRRPRIDPGIRPAPDDGASSTLPGISNSPTGGLSTTRGYRDDYYRRPTEWAPIPPANASSSAATQGLSSPPSSSTQRWSSDDTLSRSGGTSSPSAGSASAPFALQPIPNLDSRSGTPPAKSAEAEARSSEDRFMGPSLTPPERNEAPPLLNGDRDRTALIQPIPTRWAANRIEWPEQQASYDQEANSSTTHRAIHRTESERRLDTRREPTIPDDSLPPRDTNGWRSSKPRLDGWRSSRDST